MTVLAAAARCFASAWHQKIGLPENDFTPRFNALQALGWRVVVRYST